MGIALALSLCGMILLSSCDDEGPVAPAQGRDSLTAVVEGLVLPEEVTFTVTLGRGDSVASTQTHGGYFQFRDIGYGLYILDVSGKGYSEYRRAVAVNDSHTLLSSIRLESEPWPLLQLFPSDSLVLRGSALSAIVYMRFSRTMDKGSVERALAVKPPVPFTVTWEDESGSNAIEQGMTLIFNPNDLRKDVPYQLTMDTTAQTMAGSHLERQIEYPIINHSGTSSPGDLAKLPYPGYVFGPADSIPLFFSKPMDIASVTDRLVLHPSVAYHAEWDLARNILFLMPETRWPVGKEMDIGLKDGYRASDGGIGSAVDGTYGILDFAMEYIRPGAFIPLSGDELDMKFNLPIDTATLRYRISGSVSAKPLLAAPDRLLWTFSGDTAGHSFTLSIDTLLSLYGDSLPKGPAITLTPEGSLNTFRFADSSQAEAGILPSRDSLSLSCSWSAYLRLKSSGFKLLPGFPVSTQWIPGDGQAVLRVRFPQPLPSGSAWKLVPLNADSPQDSASFRTRPLAAAILGPFYGQEKVAPDEAIVLRWNTLIDTVGFAARIASEPALASLGISQDTSGGVTTTTIRHADFAKGTRYDIRVGGVTDLFAAPQADTLGLRFRTSP